MRVLYYDCFAGISGDMHLGAMIDLGVCPELLRTELSKLNINEEYELVIKSGMKNGISGTKVDVVLTGAHEHHHSHNHSHENIAGHNVHHHSHDRNFKTIKDMIERSELAESVKELSVKIFYEVAVAEAKVHGKSIDEVHFHEVGAVDSIIDVVGSAICIDALKVDKIMSSTVELGGGFVTCDHGKIPVPAPATTEILLGVPIKTGLVQKEMTTPTGAAILKAVVDEFTDKHQMNIEKTGYGLGTRTLEIPNVLRVYIGTSLADSSDSHYEDKAIASQFIIETNIDDMNGELYGYIEEQLFKVGALDVFKTPIIMKKGRPAVKLSVLINNKDRKNILEIIFKETTSGGVREYPVTKHMMKKKYRQIETTLGFIQVKDFYYEDTLVKSKAEYEDCAKIAREKGLLIKDVYKLINEKICGE